MLRPSSRLVPAALFACALLVGSAARAEDGPAKHAGLFLRLDFGLGIQGSKASPLTVSGGAGAFGFALGGAVAENHILAFHFFDTVAVGPSFSDGTTTANSGQNVSMAAIVYALNYTTYFMPANAYLSLSLGLSQLQLKVDNDTYGSKAGLGGRIQFGKEWWVSDNWGLGLAVNFTYARNANDNNTSAIWTTLAGALVFSATYN